MIFSNSCTVGRRSAMSNPESGGVGGNRATDESEAPDLNLGEPNAAQGKGEYAFALKASNRTVVYITLSMVYKGQCEIAIVLAPDFCQNSIVVTPRWPRPLFHNIHILY